MLTGEQALHSVIIGDTPDGDELIVHPDNPERIFILPRNSEDIYVAGDGLPAAIEWLCSSGMLTEAFPERNFEPFDSRPVTPPAPPPIIERDATRATYSSIFSSIHDGVDEANVDTEKAKSALFEFMSAMKEWENKFVALIKQDGWEAHRDRAEAELRLIREKYAAKTIQGRISFSVGYPLKFDPDAEKIVSTDSQNTRIVVIETLWTHPANPNYTERHRYTMINKSGEWRLDKKELHESRRDKWVKQAL